MTMTKPYILKWTPLFLTAGAAVVEVGSYLSHAGTVAREYGLPCVVDVAECTERIRTGGLIFVDGNQGAVHILSMLKKNYTLNCCQTNPVHWQEDSLYATG
ncbi:MAG: hypothetical protein D3916_16005 [Candidatus Electrothrix sp. MAN1_4]|nr:hypothetical protein [Candidatus Electrothrix sp. MAN1_4]